MTATMGTGGLPAVDCELPAMAWLTAFAPSPVAFSGRAKSEKSPRLVKPELMTTDKMPEKNQGGEFGIGVHMVRTRRLAGGFPRSILP